MSARICSVTLVTSSDLLTSSAIASACRRSCDLLPHESSGLLRRPETTTSTIRGKRSHRLANAAAAASPSHAFPLFDMQTVSSL